MKELKMTDKLTFHQTLKKKISFSQIKYHNAAKLSCFTNIYSTLRYIQECKL